MTWNRPSTWLIAGALALLLAAAAGYALGSGAAHDESDANTARDDSYQAAYDRSFAKIQAISKKQGLAAGEKRGRRAGTKTGTREGADLGGGVASVEVAQTDADAADAAQTAAEAELADRQANCGTIPKAPDSCPTSAELAVYQAAVVAARQAKRGASDAEG